MISPPHALRTESKTPRSKMSNRELRGSDNTLLGDWGIKKEAGNMWKGHQL